MALKFLKTGKELGEINLSDKKLINNIRHPIKLGFAGFPYWMCFRRSDNDFNKLNNFTTNEMISYFYYQS